MNSTAPTPSRLEAAFLRVLERRYGGKWQLAQDDERARPAPSLSGSRPREWKQERKAA